MSRVSDQDGSISRLLQGLPPWLRVVAVRQTLPFAAPNEAETLGAALLDLIARDRPAPARSRIEQGFSRAMRLWRPSPAQVAADARMLVATHWAKLPVQIRSAAAALGGWREFAESLVCDDRPDVRATATTFIVQAVEPHAWTLLAPLLNDSDHRVATLAARVLADLVLRVCPEAEFGDDAARDLGDDHQPQPFAAADVERVVLAALDLRAPSDGAEGRAVLAALLALAKRDRTAANPALALWMTAVETPAHVAVKGFLRWTRLSVARERAWEWLSVPGWANAAIDRLGRAASIADHEVVLSRSHLILHPQRAARARGIGVIRPGQVHRADAEAIAEGGPWPTPADLPQLSRAARRGLARFLEGTRPTARLRDDLLLAALTEPDPLARLAHVRIMSTRSVLEFALDAHPVVARTAAIRASAVGDALTHSPEDERLWMLLKRSPHESVRCLAKEECDLFSGFAPESTRGLLRLRQQLQVDRGATIAMLRERLAVAPAEQVARVVIAIRRLGLQDELHLELARALSVPDARAVATAAAAIGDLASVSVQDEAPLRATLQHADPRVRANAAGALLRHTPGDSTLTELKHDPHHRVRSTALRALLGATAARRGVILDAFAGLDAMLRDSRADHRLAGAWLGARTPVARLDRRERTHLRTTLASMAERDADARVRRRARGALCIVGPGMEAVS